MSRARAAAQTRAFGRANHVHHPPGTIVGSDTPDLIPDHVAIGLMLRAIAGMARQNGGSLKAYFSNFETTSGTKVSDEERRTITGAAVQYVAETRKPDEQRVIDGGASRIAVSARIFADLTQTLRPALSQALHEHVQARVKKTLSLCRS
jgi:hypothetical protein